MLRHLDSVVRRLVVAPIVRSPEYLFMTGFDCSVVQARYGSTTHLCVSESTYALGFAVRGAAATPAQTSLEKYVAGMIID
jgi:hypothetical protein